MNGLVRFVVCSLFLVACSREAFADSVTVTGNVSFTNNSLTFAPPFATQTDTGVFGAFSGGSVNYLLGTVAYTNGLPATVMAFVITGPNGDTLTFYDQVNSPSQSIGANGNLDVTLHETGYYVFDGGPALAGTFDLGFNGTSPAGSTTNVPFLGTGALLEPAGALGVAPEPASILFLGTGLLGLASLVRTRSRKLDN